MFFALNLKNKLAFHGLLLRHVCLFCQIDLKTHGTMEPFKIR